MNQNQPNYSWNGILQYLHKHHEQQLQKQSLWFLQKKQFQDHIKQLQSKVTSLQSINSDLLNRNRMLQHCLRNIRSQYKNQDPIIKQEIPKLPQRRPRPNKDQISKILYSLGVKNLIQNIQKDINQKVPNSSLNIDLQKSSTFRQKQSNLNEVRSSVYKEFQSLQGHQDGVRDLHFLDNLKILTSVSQDCTLKLWNIKNPLNINCLGTIREHSGPIFTVIQCENYILTGGMQGIIRCWNFQNVQQKKDIGKKNLIGSWMNSEEDKLQPIWQLVHSQQNNLVFSTSSQIAIKAYKINTSQGIKAQFKKSYVYTDTTNIVKEQEDIPTAICIHQNKLVAGYVTSHSLVHFDIQTSKICQQIIFDAQGQISTNKIISHPYMLIGAFEDKMVRIFDKNRMKYSFKAHDDSVMSISLLSNMNQFFSCGHDGLVKLWDLRKFQVISTFKAHDKKYDESVHCLATSSHSLAASGGADSIIKIYGM